MASTTGRALSCGALVCVLLAIDPLLGNAKAGEVERLVQLASHPSDPSVMVLRYEEGGNGLFITRDGGQDWALVCNNAIAPRKRAGPVAVAADGRVFAGDFLGVWGSDATGCGWSMDSTLADTWVRDLVAHPSDPNVLFAVTSKGAPGARNGLYRYASGQWSAVGTQAELLISRLLVFQLADGLRFYESGQRQEPREDGLPSYLIRFSDDGASTWTEHEFPPTDASMRLEGVDPTDPDRIVASLIRKNEVDHVMVSSDAGATWTELLTLTEFGGLAFAPDGRVWIGDAGSGDPAVPRGLWSAANLGASPTLLTDAYPVTCLSYRPFEDSLFVCQRFEAGRLDPSDNRVEASFSFTQVKVFASCPGVDMAATCRSQLLIAYCGFGHFPCTPVCEPYALDLSQLGEQACGFAASDASVPEADAASDSGFVATDAGRGGSGGGCGACSAAGLPASDGALFAVLSVYWLRRRRS